MSPRLLGPMRGVALGLVFASSASAQRSTPSYTIERWNTESGLPQNSVNALVQSRDGELWIATHGGVARFDGATFTTYTTGGRSGLRSDRALALSVDTSGRVWIATERGVHRVERDTIVPVSVPGGDSTTDVRAITTPRDGSVWFATRRTLIRVDAAGSRTVAGVDSLFGAILDLDSDSSGAVWVTTHTGTWRIATAHAAPERLLEPRRTQPAPLSVHPGGVWVATDSGVARVTADGIRHFALRSKLAVDDPHIREVVAVDENTVWLALGNGEIWRFSTDGELHRAAGADSRATNSMLIDREGSLWLGSRLLGLQRVRPALVQVLTTADGLAHDGIVALYEDARGTVWAGAKCDGMATNAGGSFRAEPRNRRINCVWSFAEDVEGNLWMGGSGVARIRQGRFEDLTAAGAPGSGVRSLLRDRRGVMWIGAASGVFTWNGTRFERALDVRGVQAIVESRDSTLWIGTVRGLVRIRNGERRTFTRGDGLPHDDVRVIYQDPAGAIWVGTYGGGIALLRDDRFTAIATTDGLHDNYVSAMLEDAAGNVWMSSDRGIFHVRRAELADRAAGRVARVHSVAYGRADGMLSAEANGGFTPAVLRRGDGSLWFPTVLGIAIVDPSRATGSVPPTVRLDRLLANGRPHVPIDGLELGRGSADIELRYSGVSLNAPAAVSFRYMLEGWDRDWIDAGTRRSAHYSRLTPSEYRFRVMAANRDGTWSREEQSVSFRVLPQFWQTWWFRGLAVVAIALVPLARDRQQRRRQRELTRVVDEKTRELREQARALERQNEVLAENVRLKDDVERISRHDIRTPLSSIISLAQIVREEANLPAQHDASIRLIEQAGYRVLNMASLTLDLFKMEQGTYDLVARAVDIRRVAERVLHDLQAILRTLEITCEVTSNVETPHIHGDSLLCHSMLSNLIKNAVEASPRGGRVTVAIVSDEDRVRVRIHNAGVVPPDVRDRLFEKYATGGKRGGTGLGGYSARLMAETQGGRIAVESGEPRGTTVTIELLPALPTDEPEAATTELRVPATALAEADWPPRRLLLIDDDEGNRAIVRRYLTHPRWTLDEAENGPLALRKYGESRYDFVFLDIEMPVMDGFDVAAQMRQVDRVRDVARPPTVVALSSHDDRETRDRALRGGFDFYLTKPVSRRVLVEMVLGVPAAADLDAEVRDLLPAFVEKKRSEVAQLADAIAAGDVVRVRRLSHKLRGSFSLYGFAEASDHCRVIEECAGAGQMPLAAERVTALRDYITRVDVPSSSRTTTEA